jgi:hypothetical protein
MHFFRAVLILTVASPFGLWAATTGSISGTLHDQSNLVVVGASVTATNEAQSNQIKTVTDGNGDYIFSSLAAGSYTLTFENAGFQAVKRTGVTVNADSAIRVDAVLRVTEVTQEITVSDSGSAVDTQVETVATHLGEVVQSAQMEALPLNGRAYTDLLSIQPGVTPVTTLTSTSVIMAGVVGTINPSGDLNPGNVSIDGQRESANGFMVNGIDVQEHMNGGTSVIPNLDSIAEFRVLTNNFDPEYGNYNGGMINVVSKSGANGFHGEAFEFLRNTALDARNYFSDARGVFRQNQFGGVVGGPVIKDKLFFFTDYQGTRTTQGITSALTTVPSLQERKGVFADGTVITASQFSPIARNLLQYIPLPNVGTNQFITSAFAQTVRDDKGATRMDGYTRFGQISGYYFVDDYRLDNPYPGAQGGASIPGFDALTIGRAQVITIGDTKTLGSSTVNEFHIGFLRNVNNVGQPNGGLGVSLKSQGFVTGVGTPGIVVQDPKLEGVANIVFPTFVMGVPVTNVNQWNNTLYLSNTLSKVIGNHTLKVGAQFHSDQVNEDPNATFNGTFNINGTVTGNAFEDFEKGVASNFTQSSGQRFYLRNRYVAAFAEDSWRARSNLTVNVGVRWDLIRPWSEKYNSIQTIVPGEQSVLFPNAVPGLVVPGDPGIPSTLSPTQYHNFAPRVGVAWSPKFENKLLKAVFGESGKSSIRASYGIFYTAIQGLSAGVMYGVPPFGYNYLSPAPPLLATPFINATNGVQNTDPFPLQFPPHNVSAANPDSSFNFAAVTPIGAAPFYYSHNTVPYTENYMFSIQREIGSRALATASYVGNQGHHLLVDVPANVGNPALCLSLPACGPFSEDATYTSASGQTIHGTRVGLGPNFGMDTLQKTIGNSNFNALETSLRVTLGARSTALLAYTWSKSIDDASNLGETVNPYNDRLTRVISSWDMTHNFVASYSYALPVDRWFRKNRLTEGWSLSGTTRFSTGFPVTLSDSSDNSLLGTLGNGYNNQLLDTPQVTSGPLQLNTNPRNNPLAFNTSLFAVETLGQLGNAARRMFHGPGIENFDLQLSKTVRLRSEAQSLDIRIEAFNLFNHAQFYGPAAVDGRINDSNFGRIVSAADPRLIQVAMKLHF